MTLVPLLARIVLITVALQFVAAIALVGPARLRGLVLNLGPRLRRALPYLVLLAVVLLLNSQARVVAPRLSWLLRIDLTGAIYGVEGNLVPWIQSVQTPVLTAVFSFLYVYGYVFVLVFPIVAYLALADQEPLHETCLAYTYNYAIGLVLYVIFIAYGPRNLLPGMVDALMYANWPESQLLTSQVNTNTNVFPSLHASLAVSVALLAYRTRRVYPAWLAVASVLAVGIAVATMYLGIHWGIDIVAGGALGVGSVLLASRVDPVAVAQSRTDGAIDRRLRWLVQRVRNRGR